jgi:hypothetical protein
MWIKLKTLMAGPQGVRMPGTVMELPEAEARWLVDSKQAEETSPPAPLLLGEGGGKARAKAARRETAVSKQAEAAETRKR